MTEHDRNLDLEKSVLGLLLDGRRKDAYPIAAEAGVSLASWAHPQHAAIWLLCSRLVGEGQEVDLGSLAELASRVRFQWIRDQLKGTHYTTVERAEDFADSVLPWLGGYSGISDILAVRGVSGPFEKAIALLRRYERLRSLGKSLRDASDALAQPDGVTRLEEVAASLSPLACHSIGSATTTIAAAGSQALTEHDWSADHGYRKASWGIPGLDTVHPLRCGKFCLLAAPPGGGKTSLMLQASICTAQGDAGSVAFASLEMTAEDLARRLIAQLARVPFDALECGGLTHEQRQRAETARLFLDTLNMPVRRPERCTAQALDAWIRALRQQRPGLRLVCVDYLQLIAGKNERDNEYKTLTDASQTLMRCAHETGVCVLVGSQYSRDGRKELRDKSGKVSSTPEPRQSDLRGSGSLEQDADQILAPWEPREGEPIQMVQLKHRGGNAKPRPLVKWNMATGIWSDFNPHASRIERTPEELAAAEKSTADAFGAVF